MRSALLVAAAITAIATPAVARDGSGYIGIDAGPMLVEDLDINFEDDDSDIDDAFVVDHDRGIDVDLVGGYDWGAFRTEVELGYKRAGIDEIDVGNFINAPGGAEFSADGDASVLSAMLNLLLDVGDDGLSGFVGPGIGLARIDYDADVDDAIVDGNGLGVDARDRVLAWQILAGVRTALSPNIDLGLKYRFFNSGRFEFQEDDGGGVGNPPFELNGKWRSHSLMGSLVYNFAAPPPPPPPPSPPPPPLPPPPPATQTCPDGSVILATDVCPLPPPPPPPPPPEPERG